MGGKWFLSLMKFEILELLIVGLKVALFRNGNDRDETRS